MKKPDNYKEISRKRIVELIDEFCSDEQDRKQQAFADMCGVSKYSISQYVNGSNAPGNITAAKIASVCNVNPLWVMGFDVERMSDPDRFKRYAEGFNRRFAENEFGGTVAIPIVRRVAAGIPLTSFDEVIGYEAIPESMTNNGTYFALEISGDSMAPGITDGDIIICRQQPDAEDGQIVVALINGNDGVCKRLKRYSDGTVALLSDNTAYPPMYFKQSEIDTIPVQIKGVVKELRRKM